MLSKLSYLLLVFLFAAFTQADFIQPLTRTPLRPFSVNQNYTTDYSFSAYIPSSITDQATIEVEFPLPYSIPSACQVALQIPSNSTYGTYSCTKTTASKYVIDVGQIVAGEYQFVFQNIENPSAYPASSNFKIRTYYNQEILVDSNEYFDSVPFLPTPVISYGASVQNLGYSQVNLGSKFDFTFTLTKSITKGDSMKINFPVGFYFVKPACFHRNSGSYTSAEVLYNNRMLICQSFQYDIPANKSQIVSILGLVNPGHAGFFLGSYLETMEGLTPNIIEKILVNNPIEIDPGSVTVEIISSSVLLAINTTHQLNLLFDDDVPSTAQVWIKIPSGFSYLATNCTLLRPLQAAANSEVTCGLAANNTGYIINGFSIISASQQVSVLISVQNPAVVATYTIPVYSYSTIYQAKIDEGSGTITLNDTYGSSRYFAAHALQWTEKLKYNQTGPIEFTFFLNIPLPATTSTFQGKIEVDIKPQIPYPPVGTLRCFFNNTVPGECTWNTSLADRTILTIFTPATEGYFQSEVPITVTTETDVGNFGIKLPELIQRYKFYFYFYRNGETMFHEVYYEDWVPDPIVMPSTWYTATFAPLQYGQESYLNIAWTNNYLNLSTNYFFELEFDHSNLAWDFNLGWPATQWYETLDMPCIGEGLGPNVRCVLKPGGAQYTTSYIQMIGLSEITYGVTYNLHFPKIKFGTSGKGTMLFTLYENTPGESTLKIPIVTATLSFTPNAAQTYSTGTFTTLSLTPNQPDYNSTLAMAFTSSANPAYTIYSYPANFSLQTGLVSCGGSNLCYAFDGDNVNWLVFKPSPTQGTATSTTLTILTAPYVGSYRFTAKTTSGGSPVQNYIATNYTLNPAGLTVTLTADASNPQINSNSILLFDVKFTTVTHLPANASVQIVFTQLTVPQGDSFYCQVVSGLVEADARGVACTRISATTIRLNNINETVAGTAVSLIFQLKTNTQTTVTAVASTYYYFNAIDLVDRGTGSATLTYKYTNFLNATLFNDRSGELVRVGTTGIFNFNITSTGTYTTATVAVTFDAGFDVTATTDVLLCRINNVRRRCTYTRNPLVVTITGLAASTFTATTLNTISISSDFETSYTQGIVAPTTPGWHPVNFAILVGGTIQEQIADYIYIYPSLIPLLSVSAVPATASQLALYTFSITLSTALNSNLNSGVRGRMFIDFPTGSDGFAVDLGTGLSTGEYVGCNVEGLTTLTNIHCRLIASLGNGSPASVEIIGFDAITAATAFTIRIGGIKNPSLTAGEYVFAFRTDQYTTATGVATPLEYTRYALWNLVTALTAAVPSYLAPDSASFQSQAAAGQSSTDLTIDLYAGRALAVGDYYVYALPTEVVPSMTLTCPARVSNCWGFPDNGWVVYQLGTALPAATVEVGDIQTVTIPARLSTQGYTFTAYAWKSDQLDHTIDFTINNATYTTLTGNIVNKKLTVVADQLVTNRVNTECFVEFTPSAAIPNTGTIQITFPTGFTVHANCKSALSAGSGLTSTTGMVACAVQGTSWIVTNFDNVAASTPIKIYGLIDLPSTAGTYNPSVKTYANQDADIANNGQPIETATTGFGLTISTMNTLSLDVGPTSLVNERIQAATASYHPLVFDFTVTQATAATTIQLRVDGSTTGFSSTRTTGEPYICYFEQANTSAITACTVTTTTASSILTFSLTPKQTLSVNTDYRCVITTAFAANGNDGVVFPTAANVYKAAVVVTTGTAQQTDITFFELVPSEFASLIVKSYVIAMSQENVIDISLTTPTGKTITATQRLVVELPTTFNGTNMFDEDVGQGLLDNAAKPCDVISSVPTGVTMSCFFQKGNRIAGTPASVVVYGFSAAFSNLRFAFTVNNPAITTSTVIPLTIYTMLGTNAFTKTYYQHVENAVLVRDTAATLNANQQTAPTYSVQTLSTKATLTINVYLPNAMTTSDYYVISTPQMSSSGKASVNTLTAGFGTAQAIVLPQCQFIIVSSTAGQAAAGTYSLAIPNVYNPDVVLTTAQNTFSAMLSSFVNLATTNITYAAGTITTTLSTTPTVTLSNLNTQRESIMTITINTAFKGIRSVIIVLGTRVTVEDECYEGPSSAILIQQCATVPASNQIIVTLENAVYSTAASSLVVRLPVRNGATAGAVDGISYYFYSTVATSYTVTTGQVSVLTSVTPGITLTTVAPSAVAPTLAEFVYTPYSENRQGIVTGAYGDLLVTATLTAAVTAGQEVQITLDNFNIAVTTNNIGDVSGSCAAIITNGGNNYLITATIQNQNVVSITLPTGTTLAAGATTFRITQMGAAGDQVGVTAQTTTTDQLQVTMNINDDTGNLVTTEASAAVSSFLTRNLNPTRAPIRLRFEVAGTVSQVVITLPANSYNYDTTSNGVCYFRAYSTILDYVETQAQTCTITGTLAAGFTITATSAAALTTNTLYELVVETDSATSPYFNIFTATNQQAVVGFYNTALTLIAATNIYLYQYQATPLVSVTDFYYVTGYSGDPDTLIFQTTVNTAIPAYPTTLIELELTSASSALLQSGMASGTVSLECGILGPTKRTVSVDNLRCSIVPTSPPRVRIENYQAITAGTSVYFILYDLDNSVVAADFVSSFSSNLIVTNTNTFIQSQHRLTRMFVTETGSVASAAQVLTFPTSSATTYGTATTLTKAITWGTGESCDPCRFIVRGIDTDYDFPATNFAFLINTDTETTLVDTVNNIFVVLSAVSPMTAGTQYTFSFGGTNMLTPQSYQRNSGTIQIDLYGDHQSLAIYNLTGSYPTLTAATVSTTTAITCTTFASAVPGTNGNVDCVVRVPLGSGSTNITGVVVDLPNTNGLQYSEVYNYCNAYVSAGSATALKSMLTCSRQDPTTTNARFFITGFQYVAGSTISFTLRARAVQSTSITATVQLQATDSTTGSTYTVGQTTSALSIASAFSTSYAAPTAFSVSQTYEAKVAASSTSPLRAIMNFGANLNVGGSVTMTLGSGFALATGIPLCTIRDVTTYDAPYLTKCAYASNVYTLTLIDAIPSGRYLVEVTSLQKDMATEGVTFPTNTKRTSLTVQVNSAAATTLSVDLTYVAAAPGIFPAFSIAPQRNKIPLFNSQFNVNIQVSTLVDPDTTSEENLIVISFPTSEYDADLGASTTTFSADNIPYYNGMAFAGYFSGLGTSAVSSLHYGYNTEPALVIISGHSGLTANTATIVGLDYIKNPAANKGMSAKISILNFASGQYYPTVLYEAQYTNFFNTITAITETAPALTVSASSMTPYVSMTLTLSGKNYGTDVDTTSIIYIKLKNEAEGFDYTAMTGLTCTGYSVQWYKEDYTFYLTPLTDLGTQTPTIVCTGFVLSTNTNDIEIETGIYKEGYGQTAASYNTLPIGTQSTTLTDTIQVTRVSNLANVESVNLYQITYNPQTFTLAAGTYFVIQIPSGLQVIPGRTEYITYTALTDNTATAEAVHATLVNGNIMVSGYAAYSSVTDGVMTLQFFLRNIAAGNQQFRLTFYEANGNQIIQSSLSQAVTVSTTPNPVVAGTFGPYLTDTLDVYGTEQYPFKFMVQIANTMSATTNGKFVVTLPTGFTLTSGQQICKYSSDNGTHWIWSTSCTVAGSTVTIPLQTGFDLQANSVIYLTLTTISSNFSVAGIVRPNNPVINTFQITSQQGTTVLESVYLPLVVYPPPLNVTAVWYTRGAGQDTVVSLTFSVATALTTSDYIQLEFIANDEIIQVFPNDLGTGSTENRILGNCGRDPSSTAISANALLDCYIIPGIGSTNPSTNVNAKVVTQIDNAIAASTTLRYLIAGIQNPTTAIPGGFVFTVMRPCRNDGYGCPLFRRRNYANIIRAVSPTAIAMSVPTLQAGDTNLFVVGVETTLTLGLSTNVATTDAIVIKTDLPNMALQSPCTSPTGTCINFPALGWTFFQPSAQLTSGTKSFSVVLDNGLFYDRTNTLQWRAETWISGSVNQVFTSDHPNYNVMVPTLLTNMTQADPAIQEIVTNFVNILQLSMTSIWRTDMVRRIIVNIPSSYAPIDNYCMAGVNLDDISNPNYTLFACNKTGDRQVLIVIDDEWEPTDASLNVVLYYRGLLRVNATTGTSTASTITSYASLDPTEVWVVDENTGYQFYVSPIPTPIIRDLNLNLKSFNDRKAQILDYVEFYGAIWPYTQFDPSNNETLITQILFEIDDEFSYPTMSTLVCYIKVIFRQYCNCTLSRTSGKTLVLMEMPPDYENGPFLFTITNTQENLLFQAPDHEGNFAFNITMENQYGDTVEQASTTVSISGEEISNFSAQPILIDPLVQTLYEIDFTTEARVTPQGFMEEGQTVSTEIVLEFQTFDPAFPIDLGTGLADGSAIACIPVQGITITKTGELTCTIVYGTTTDPTQIIITNYDAIPALTSVIIYIDGISTLGLNATSRINLEVYSTYSGSSAQYEFYYSEQVSPTAPTASIAKSPAALQISHGGSNGLQETSNYNFTFTTTTALTANQDWIIIEFPEYGYEQNADYSSVLITIVTPSATSSGYVMPIRNIIYLQPKLAIAAGQVIVSIADLPNPSFVLTGATTFTVETVVNRKIVDVFTNTYTYSSETCSLFSNEKITYSSAYALVNENTYQISFTVDHDVPADGSLAVIFDSSLYNLKPSNPTCQLVSGFSSAATCDFELFSQQLVRVNLNGVAITSGTQVQLNILNVNNPTSSTASPVITIQSYFDDSFGTTKTICSVDVTLPAFNAVSLVSCPIDIEPEINNVNQVTAYLINIYCSTSIRNATTIDIQFPTAFQNSFSTDLSCTTNGNYMLQDCSLIARTTRVTVLISQPNVQAALVVRVRNVQNPSLPGTYGPFSVTLSQYDVQYGLLDSTRSSASVTIVSDRDVVTNSNALALSIFPKNYGEKAVYYFNLIGLEPNKVPSEVLIQFDKDFAQDIGPSIECGTFTPQQQYGDSYALNYEDLQNHNMLDCSVIDNQLIQMQLTPIINMVAGQAQDIFFFISNVINPSLTQDASSTSYSFNFTFTLDQAAVIISQNTVSIDFELPPSLLEISSVSTTETNILSPANYNLTFKAIQNLPISIDSEANDYELLIGFQASQYPTLMQDTLSYSFPNNTALLADSSAFAYNNAVYIRADYPDFAVSGSFIVSFNNMTNPDVESQCGAGAQGLPVKFESQYVNREEGYVFGRTYNIMDQGNCLTLNKNRSAITVVAPLYLRQGLVYTLQLQVEEPAADLSITPIANFLTFTPTTVTFSDYTTSVMEVKVHVSKYVPVGDYTIQWRKTETSNVIRYLEIEDTNVIVVSESTPATVSPLPNIDVESIRYIWTGKMPREVTITLSQEPADEITLEVNTKVVDSNLQASLDGVTFSNFPISITFGSGDLEQMFFIYADVGAKDNVLTYTLTGENANVFDPNIPNSPFIIRNRQGINTFQILSIQSLLTNENSADYLVSLSDIGTVYYLAVIKNAITPTLLDLIQGELDNVDTQYYQAGSVEIEKVQGGTSLSSYINFTSLAAQTNYQIYFVARSVYGEYTAMQMTEIQTRKISDGANVWIPTFAEVDPDDLIEALSIILPIAQSRLYFAEAETYPQDPSDGDDPVIGSQLDQYRIIIAPDRYENDPTPMEIAQSLLTSNKQTQLLALVPQFYMQSSLRITPVKRPSPEFIINPSVGSIGYYNIQINVELISIGKLYAIVTARSGVGDMVPTSYQIANGLAADNTQVSSDFYQMVFTNDNGNGQLVFTELKDYTEYNVYVTAGSDVPYEPAELLDDSSVYQMTITTLKNPNLGSFAEANALYDIYYDSLLQNYGYRISTVFVSLLVVMTAMLWF